MVKFKFDENIDVIALLALCLSCFLLIKSCYDDFSGSEIVLIAPESIKLFHKNEKHKGIEYQILTLSAPLSYINNGPKGQDGIVTKELVKLTLGTKSWELKWDSFVDSTWENSKVHIKNEKNIGAFPIVGRGTASHETVFIPIVIDAEKNRGKNFCLWDKHFLTNLTPFSKLSVKFTYRTNSGKESSKCCEAILYENLIESLKLGGAPIPLKELSCTN